MEAQRLLLLKRLIKEQVHMILAIVDKAKW
jgi:hypothetical protein